MAILKSFDADRLHVTVADSRLEMGRAAARAAAETIRRLLGEKDEINMIFAAAPSQNETLECLVAEPGIDWTRVNAYHMDEYVGLDEGAPQTFGEYLRAHVFSLVPFRSVNYLRGYAPDADAECGRYSELLRSNPVDIVMLGIGENGHIAFNDPWVADFEDPRLVKKVPLDPVCRMQQVNDGCFEKLEDVPEYALSLTIPALANADYMFCTVPAKTKTRAVTRTVKGEISVQVPATIMRRHQNAYLFCDQDSGAELLTERKLCVAIIGQGRSGRDIHGAFFRSAENTKFEVVAVVDELPERRERAKAEYGCDVYADIRELYGREDIDLVVNSTYSHLHFPVTMELIRHGFNVVCEKPFSARRSECEGMIYAAKQHGRLLSVFQQSHFAPYFVRIREILASGILGRPVQISVRFNGFARRWDWQTSQRFYGGSLRNTGPHPVEQILTLLDTPEMPRIVSKLDKVNTYGDAEDYVKVLFMAPDRPLADLEISSCDGYSDYLYKIQCAHGCLKATMNTIEYKYYVPEDEPKREIILEPLCKEDGTPSYCTEKLTWHTVKEDMQGTSFNTAVKAYYDNIYDHMTKGAELIIKPENLLMEIDVFEEVHRQNPLPVMY